VAIHLATVNEASVDLYVERNDSGTWRVDNSTQNVTSSGWINMTTSGHLQQERRVRVNWSATESTTSTLDRILAGGGDSGTLFTIPILLIPVTPAMGGLGVVAIAVLAIIAWRRYSDDQ
jgi:hypothetical protein